jgi:hypothetical protein
MITVPASWKDCVTCERWGGQRKPTPFRDGVEYDPSRDNGECLGGGWDRMQIGAMQPATGTKSGGRCRSGLRDRRGRAEQACARAKHLPGQGLRAHDWCGREDSNLHGLPH